MWRNNSFQALYPLLFASLRLSALGQIVHLARHTWATIAASLDIPKETISAALGHEIGSPITSIYIKFDQKKVDEANRLVIDYVNDPVKFMKDRKNTK